MPTEDHERQLGHLKAAPGPVPLLHEWLPLQDPDGQHWPLPQPARYSPHQAPLEPVVVPERAQGSRPTTAEGCRINTPGDADVK